MNLKKHFSLLQCGTAGRPVFLLTLLVCICAAALFFSCNNPSSDPGSSTVNVTGVTLSKTSKSTTVGSKFPLTATIAPANASDKSVSWSSSAPSIASVEGGTVTAAAAGTAVITVTAASGGFTAACTVTVADVMSPVTGVTLDVNSKSIKKGDTFKLTATVAPVNADNKNVHWTSSAPAVASVSADGTVTAAGKGTATITATTEEGSKVDSCEITVTVPVTGVTLNSAAKTLGTAQTFQLIAVIAPADADNMNVAWTSSAPAVATVSPSGLITGVTIGSTTITAETADGSFTATCAVTVTNPVTGVALDVNSKSMKKGDTFKLTATVAPANADNKNVVWTSSAPAVASVSADGTVTAAGKGTATITATTEDGSKADSCEITVTVPVTGVTLNSAAKTLGTAQTFQLIAVIAPADADNMNVAWTSSAPAVATVSPSGLITGVTIGSTTITAKTADGNFTATCAVTVTNPVTGVTLDVNSKNMKKGDTFKLTATVAPANADNKNVVWTSSAPAVASVSADGTVTAAGKGTATITVTTADGNFTATCAVTVTNPVTGVTLSQTSKNTTVGSEFSLTATVVPANADNQNVHWTSSAHPIATVDQDGTVTAVAAGTAVITVKTDGGEFTATCTVTVTAVPVTGVTVSPSSALLVLGGSHQFTAAVTPADATDKKVTWTSSDPGVVSVDQNGKVTAHAAILGVVTITATSSNGIKGTATVSKLL